MQAPSRYVSWTLVAVGLATTSVACKDQAQCDEALQTARKALQDDYLDFESARKWREHAGKICGAGPEIEALDKEIVSKEEAVAKAAKERAEKEAENGKKAMEVAGELWAKFGKLDDDKKTKKKLNSTRDKIKKMTKGLTEEYAKQVNKFNNAQYKKHKKDVKDD